MSKTSNGHPADGNWINVSTTIVGTITSKGNIRLDGKLNGDLKADGGLLLGPSGEISGNVESKSLVSGGKITGKVVITERTVLESTSVFQGDLFTKKLIIEEGASFDGTCSMTQPGTHAGPETKK